MMRRLLWPGLLAALLVLTAGMAMGAEEDDGPAPAPAVALDTSSLLAFIRTSPDTVLIQELVKKLGNRLDPRIRNLTNGTVFLPNDDALHKLGWDRYGNVNQLMEDKKFIASLGSSLLPYHTLPGAPRLAATFKVGMQLKSLLNDTRGNLTVVAAGTKLRIKGFKNTVEVVKKDIKLMKNFIVVHMVSSFLTPPPIKPPPKPKAAKASRAPAPKASH